MSKLRAAKRWAMVGALALAAAAAFPVSGSAHPSEYTDVSKVVPDNPPSPLEYDDLIDQNRYVVCNHGYCHILLETNGVTNMGMVDYKRIPGDWRDQAGVTVEDWFAVGTSGAQPHHSCSAPALSSIEAITGWQEDPFYAYVPFQKEAFGLDDTASDWLPYVEGLTGVDLSTVSDDPATALTELEGLCASIGGTLLPADEVHTPAEEFNASTTLEAIAPLEQQIQKLKAKNRNKTEKISNLRSKNKNLKKKISNLRKRL